MLYVTGEESAEQVRLRADRVGAVAPKLYLAAETDLAAVLGQIDSVAPELIVVDSIQTIGSAEIDGAPGGVSQVREVAANLIRVAKERGITTVVVGHVTKDGSIAGPRVLEHLVDVVLYFEGDRHSRLRMIRAVKNRYGPTDELGCFDLSETGIVGLPDPSGLFLTRQEKPAPGTCVTVTLEGRRPLVAEVQSLVAPSPLANPRRMTSGLDSSRVAMMLAVLQRRVRRQAARPRRLHRDRRRRTPQRALGRPGGRARRHRRGRRRRAALRPGRVRRGRPGRRGPRRAGRQAPAVRGRAAGIPPCASSRRGRWIRPNTRQARLSQMRVCMWWRSTPSWSALDIAFAAHGSGA